MRNLIILMSIALFSQLSFAGGEIKATIQLTVGSFEATSTKVKGTLLKSSKGNLIKANELKVSVKSFDTGINLRNKHMYDYMGVKKQKQISVSKIQGKNNVGIALVSFNGVSNKVKFKYTLKGSKVIMDFNLSLAKFNVKGISYNGIGVKDSVAIHGEYPFVVK